ncbi:nucleotidyltransferase substrate binding protein [Endozoicomonas sp. Mp262]|uniref:nucleotidyltransferase substrate binding protein n=1 Tax=Endozoicomonas sp. Mp262 TaxID=2919499 RepID=UPI0021DAB792
MTEQQDVRWVQRFENFRKALASLKSAVELAQQRTLTDLERQGVIQGFEFTHELAWNTLKDFLTYQGINQIIGSRDATRAAFKTELITEGDTWMDMIKSRNLTSHTYREEVAREIGQKILSQYYPAYVALEKTLTKRLANGEE